MYKIQGIREKGENIRGEESVDALPNLPDWLAGYDLVPYWCVACKACCDNRSVYALAYRPAVVDCGAVIKSGATFASVADIYRTVVRQVVSDEIVQSGAANATVVNIDCTRVGDITVRR